MAVSLRSSSSSRIVVRAAIVPVSVLLHADRTLTGRLRDVETVTRIVPSCSMWFPIPVTCIYYLWFQALQQHRFQRRAMDLMTWVRCFTLFMAVLSQRSPDMVPDMVAHLHTVLCLQQKATSQLAWLEYDIQFRMKLPLVEVQRRVAVHLMSARTEPVGGPLRNASGVTQNGVLQEKGRGRGSPNGDKTAESASEESGNLQAIQRGSQRLSVWQ